jgi:transcriptional regulator with XRE-family HTH domain
MALIGFIMAKIVNMAGDEAEAVKRLGERLRLARLRRNLSQADVATRAGIMRKTVVDLEAGKPTVSIGVLVKAMAVLGYLERIPALLESDSLGEDLEAVHGRKRAGSRHGVADF